MELQRTKLIDKYVGGLLIVLLKPLVKLLGLLLNRNHDLIPKNEILYIKLVGGGSLLLATQSILSVKSRYPTAHIALLTSRSIGPFASAIGLFDKIYYIDDRNFFRATLSYLLILPKILFVDTCIDLEVHSRISTVVSTLTLARNRIGFFIVSVYWRTDIYTHSIFFNPFSPSYVFYDFVAILLKGAEPTPMDVATHLSELVRKSPPPNSVSLLRKSLVLGTTCSENGRERMLSYQQWVDWFKTFNDFRPEEYGQIVLLGSNLDKDFNSELATQIRKVCPLPIVNLTGDISLLHSVGIIQKAKLFVGIDSSLLHFARAFGVPTISFWGPTAPETRLRNVTTHEKIYYSKTACSPCIHTTEFPPCFGKNICISNIFSKSPQQFTPITSFHDELKVRVD